MKVISEISRIVMNTYRINIISFQYKQACHLSTARVIYLEKKERGLSEVPKRGNLL